MTANHIAKVVESLYNKVDIDKMSAGFDKLKQYNDCGRTTDEWINRRIVEKSYVRWIQSMVVLEDYCRTNFTTFEQTELVYKWAKKICEHRNYKYNEWRANGGYTTFEKWIKNNY
jgi:hypothetical protein